MKKLLSVFLCAVMLLSVLAGCAPATPNPTTTAPSGTNKPTEGQPTETTAPPPTALDKLTFPLTTEDITLTGVVIAPLGDRMDNRGLWEAITELTGVKFEWITIDSEAATTFLAGGKWEFDFILDPLTSAQLIDYGVDGNKLVDYNEYLDFMPNLRKALADFPAAKKISTETNGAMYGLPRIAEEITSAQNRAFVNIEVLKDAGWDVKDIKTVDDLYECLKDLKEKNGKPALNPFQRSETASFVSTIYQAFGTESEADFVDDGAGNVIYNRVSEQYRRYLTYMNKLYEEGLIFEEFLTSDLAASKAMAFEGTLAFMQGEANSLTGEHFKSGNVDITILDPLTSEYDKTQTYFVNHPVKAGGGHINAESEHIELICQIFDIAFAEEEVAEGSGLSGISFWYGKLGENIILNDDGTFEQKAREGFTGSFAEWTREWHWGTTSFGRDTVLGEAVTSTPGNGQARHIAFRDHVKPFEVDYSEIFPGNLLKYTSDETSDRAGKMADVQAYVNEMQGKFITGVADIETEWDAYVQGLYDRGLQTVIDITQDAYDRWIEMG